jgi:glycosyltransferase involved in cell wall biosynthesis
MRLLAITNEFPLPLDRGGPMRFFGLARALAEHHEVHMLALRRPSTTDALVDELASVLGGPVEVFDPPPDGGGWARAVVRGVPPWVAAQRSPELERRALELVRDVDAVAILDDYAGVYAPGLVKAAPVVCDKSNVLGWSSAAAPAQGVRARARKLVTVNLTRRWEGRYIAPSTAVVVTSEDEGERLRELYGRAPDAVVPSAVDVPDEPVTPRGAKVIGWLGTHEYVVNVEGLVRFVEEGWGPLGADGFRLLVAGGSPPDHVRALERHAGVEVLGFVDDLDVFFAQLGAAVVPLWHGAGVKLKTLAFMAAGVPVVGTSVAVEGLDVEHRRDCLVAEDPGGLAAGLRNLVADVEAARRIGAEGRRLVAHGYSWPSVGARFREAVERAATARS